MVKGYSDTSELTRRNECKSSHEIHIDFLNQRIDALQRQLKAFESITNVQTEIFDKEGRRSLLFDNSNIRIRFDKENKDCLNVMVCEI